MLQKQCALAAEQPALNAKQPALTIVTSELTAVTSALRVETGTLAAKAMRLAGKQAALTAETSALTTETMTLTSKQTALATETMTLAPSATPLTQKQTRLTQKQRALNQKQTALARKQTALPRKQTRLIKKQTPLPSEQTALNRKPTTPAQKRTPLTLDNSVLAVDYSPLSRNRISLTRLSVACVTVDVDASEQIIRSSGFTMTPHTNAWMLNAVVSKERQYRGNVGYPDELKSVYPYDTDVQNHRQIACGDFVVVRADDVIIGAGRIESIEEAETEKTHHRCPKCNSTTVRERKHASPKWRCSKCGAKFDAAKVVVEPAISFAASYARTFVEPSQPLAVAKFKAVWAQASDQLSIRKLDTPKLEQLLLRVWPEAVALLGQTIIHDTIGAAEGEDDTAFTPSNADGRKKVLRNIIARRGRAKFRNVLLKRYDGRCVVTGCACADLLEAAHIAPYRGEEYNHRSNGLLLRADMHTLFDLNLMAINPADFSVHFHPFASRNGYAAFDGAILSALKIAKPSQAALQTRWSVFQEGVMRAST